MKRIFALVLAVIMVLTTFTFGVTAAPTDECYVLDERGSYAFFTNIVTAANDTTIIFDMSLARNSDGAPNLSVNSAITITPSSIKIGDVTQNISWGALEVEHWRRVEIKFTADGCSVCLDGEQMIFAPGVSGRTDGFYLIAYPGTHYFDNVSVTSGGVEKMFIDFSDTGVLGASMSADCSGNITSVPYGSYYDYEGDAPDNITVLFNSSESCEKLTVGAVKTILVGDINTDGKINSRDGISLKKVNTGNASIDISIADFDNNNKINAKDAISMKKTIAGLSMPIYREIGTAEGAAYDETQEAAKLTAEGTVSEGIDATLLLDDIDASVYKFAVVTYMTPDSEEFSNTDAACQSAFGAYGNLITYDLICDGYFHSEVIDLSEMSTWNGDKVTIRYFLDANEGDTIFIDSVVFCATNGRASAAASNRAAAKSAFGIYDDLDPSGPIGSFDENGNYVIRFDIEEKVSYKVTNSNNSEVSYDDDSLKAVATAGIDPSIYIDLSAENISSDTYKFIVYTYKIPTTTQRYGPLANIYFVNEHISAPTAGYETPSFGCEKTGKYATVVINASNISTWKGQLTGFRVDFFTDCYAGDTAYIDSIIFAKDASGAASAGDLRVKDRNGVSLAASTAEIWNDYYMNHKNANGYEYVNGSGSEVAMHFRFHTDSARFTARSLGDRMGRAISQATGKEVICEVNNGFVSLKNSFNSSSDHAAGFIHYTLTYKGESYNVRLYTHIYKDDSFHDELDGTANDPEIIPVNTGTWFSDGLTATDSVNLPKSEASLAIHSNHETRLVDTPYGSFAVIPTWENSSTWGTIGGAGFSLYRIYDDGTCKELGGWSFAYHTSKPNIMYAADGLVYVISTDDQWDHMNNLVLYFDPSEPNSDGTYDIHGGRTTVPYQGGPCPSGYGYLMPVLDDTNGKIYVIACGGKDEGYFAWSIYNYREHEWEPYTYSTVINSYRHCYIYAFSDGKDGIYLVAGRDVLLSTIGLAGTVTGADYAWDEMNVFHFPNMYSTAYTRTCIIEADYTQTDRQLYPIIGNNRHGDALLTNDGYLHVLSTKSMHGTNHHDHKYSEMWHSVYDCRTPGMKPLVVYNKPIVFATESSEYTMRMAESVSGELYILAMPTDTSARVEIWKEADDRAYTFELAGCKNFSDGNTPCSSIITTNSRNGSVINNKVPCFYPIESGGKYIYKYFTITLP